MSNLLVKFTDAVRILPSAEFIPVRNNNELVYGPRGADDYLEVHECADKGTTVFHGMFKSAWDQANNICPGCHAHVTRRQPGPQPHVASSSRAEPARPLNASRVTKKQVDPIKALLYCVLGLAAAAALGYLLVHLGAILAPLGLATGMANAIFGVTGGSAIGSLYVGLKNFAAFVSSLGTDPAVDEAIRRGKEQRLRPIAQ